MDLLGTRFEEEERERNTHFYNQRAKDHKGRVRWQGAFTGGFVAGYRNTCGSKNGYEPGQIRGKNNQTVFDYMDEEDYGLTELGHDIVIQEEYQEGTKTIGWEILNTISIDRVEDFKDMIEYKQPQPKQNQYLEQAQRNKYQGLGESSAESTYYYKEAFLEQSQDFNKIKKREEEEENRIYANLLYQPTDSYEEHPQISYHYALDNDTPQIQSIAKHQPSRIKDIFIRGEVLRRDKTTRLDIPPNFKPFSQIDTRPGTMTKNEVLSHPISFVPAGSNAQVNIADKMDDLQKIIKESQQRSQRKRFYVSDVICQRFGVRPPKDNAQIKAAEEKIKESKQFMNTFDKHVMPHYQDQLMKKVKDNRLLNSKFSSGQVLVNDQEVDMKEQGIKQKPGLQIMDESH